MDKWSWVFKQGAAADANYQLSVSLEDNYVELVGSTNDRPWGGSKSTYTVNVFSEMLQNDAFIKDLNHPLSAVYADKKLGSEVYKTLGINDWYEKNR